ncbi:YdeI/OmpD-associated family protein [Draconibacterium sp. IB214405]|uniref:YdeI/OmpD-associated family protein n=1 Tax=Draconibacterium sp. IB214405 TaxID=3097352 RepID=UPI002A173E3F|nr:YdeI/OmpD-associated family protein [Draconibacterium sp. IB214405]MDX8337968.1 YdeI/OmpD-associated family protein [Draconibacterium sp. IB214405]
MKKQYFKTYKDWEKWLDKNHKKENELWLIYYKKHTGKPCIAYNDSVKTALCYGWIDGLVKRIDDECYARKFTPRNAKSLWSESNKKRVTELLKEGKMKPPGLKLVEAAKQNGNWDKVIAPPEVNTVPSAEFKSALSENPEAKAYFESLAINQKNQFIIWINMAKRDETKAKRIKESIDLLKDKKKLGLK